MCMFPLLFSLHTILNGMTIQTLGKIASCSKAFLSTSIALLMDD